jgi:hypothetical protein
MSTVSGTVLSTYKGLNKGTIDGDDNDEDDDNIFYPIKIKENYNMFLSETSMMSFSCRMKHCRVYLLPGFSF